jgi:protein-S-isoprenylcysteine O-methyltransferase Ste14
LFSLAFAISLGWRNTAMGILLAPTLLHEFLTAASFLVRRQPRARSMSFTARGAAYLNSYMLPLYFLLPIGNRSWHSPNELLLAGGLIWLTGCLLSVWGIWNLRHSFSIEPQARDLVTSGPYRFVRHPLYAAYVLQYAGAMMRLPSMGFAVALAAWFLLLLVRIHHEERVLMSALPGYEPYRRRVGALIPRIRSAPAAGMAAGLAPVEVRQ